jgi:hypothetical protein
MGPLLLALWISWQEPAASVVWIVGAIVGGFIGYRVSGAVTTRLPVRLRRYAQRKGTVALHFRSPEFAARFLAAMREISGPSNQQPPALPDNAEVG